MVAILPHRKERFCLLILWLFGLLQLVYGDIGFAMRCDALEPKYIFELSDLWHDCFVSGKICSIGLGDTRGSLWNKQTISKR